MPDPSDWLLTQPERGNPATRLDDLHPGEQAWSEGNLVRPLIHGATYFAELYERIEATRAGDLVFFTDWQGDADERLTGEPGSEVAEVLGRADERGVDVRGLVWRSHSERDRLHVRREPAARPGPAASVAPRRSSTCGCAPAARTTRSSSSSGTATTRRATSPTSAASTCATRAVTTPTTAATRRPRTTWPGSTARRRRGTTSRRPSAGPAVHDVETVFRERWEDPTTLSRSPVILLRDRLRGLDTTPDPLPEQAPPPPPVDGGGHVVQLLRTYPNLRRGRDYAFARGGERSVARGYTKAVERARHLIYVEDQYLWGDHVGSVFTEALAAHPELHVIAVVPMLPDVEGFNRTAQLVGRRRAMLDMARAAPDRVAVYGIENHAGTPVYVHAKTCVVDDTWATIGSDNFNRRSWTHDSELSVVVVDPAGDYARSLRLALAAEHLDREPRRRGGLRRCRQACSRPTPTCADALDRWHAGGQVGPRPPGRLRRLAAARARPGDPGGGARALPAGARPGRTAQAAAQAATSSRARR